ncbi:MAG: hypothetical protein ACUVRS_08885 [Armatimonadota bacterium]
MLTTRGRCSRILIFVLWCALAILACGCGGGGGGSVDTTPPVISSPSVQPTLLPPVGADVTIRATVTDNVGVASVTATITKPDNSKITLTMNLSGASTYTATWKPDVTNIEPGTSIKIVITAKDAAGNTANSPVFTFEEPPPPPPPPTQ